MNEIGSFKNSVGPSISLGKDNPISLHTDSYHVYRVTGMDQIEDIIECGYVRPKGYGSRRQRVGDKVYWSIGGNLYYFDKRPVLESTIENVRDGQIEPVYLDDLTAIWIFDEIENKYVDRLDYVKELYDAKNKKR